MRTTARLISLLSLLGVVGPPVLYLLDRMALPSVKTWILVFTVMWFATVPLWMDRGEAS